MADISVSGAGQVQKNTPQPNDISQAGPSVGAGSIAAAGAVPDAGGQSYVAISQSLSKFFPTITGDKIDILIAEASLKLKDIVGKTDLNELQAKEEQKRQNAAEQRAAAEDAQKALEDARAAEAKSKKAGLFGKIFGGLAAAISIAVGAMLIATGAGAVLGAALIVSGVASAAMLADQLLMEHTGMGLMSHVVKDLAGTVDFLLPFVEIDEAKVEKFGEKLDKGFKWVAIAVIVLSAVVTLGVGFAGTGAAGAGAAASAGAGGAAGGGAAGGAGSVGVVAAKSTQHLTTFQKFSTGTSIVVDAGGAASSLATATLGYMASKDQAFAMEERADVARSQALNELLNDFIDQILNRIGDNDTILNAKLDDVVKSQDERGKTLASARFAG